MSGDNAPTYSIATGESVWDPMSAQCMAEGELFEMPPEQFLALTPAPEWWSGEGEGYDRAKQRLLDGDPLDVPYLHVWCQTLSHEGRHRALAAKDVGLEMIPVAVLKESPSEAEIRYCSAVEADEDQRVEEV